MGPRDICPITDAAQMSPIMPEATLADGKRHCRSIPFKGGLRECRKVPQDTPFHLTKSKRAGDVSRSESLNETLRRREKAPAQWKRGG